MTEKNALANALDKALDSLSKRAKSDDGDVLNMLSKPSIQSIGDGFILWRWNLDSCVVESVLATRQSNDLGLNKDSYVVNLHLPESDEYSYTMFDDTAKEIGSTLLSAWNWQNIWKMHVGDFLLESLSQEPAQVIEAEPEIIERETEYVVRPPERHIELPLQPETIDVVEEAVLTTPTFDNG
jgi:hypothetical protein